MRIHNLEITNEDCMDLMARYDDNHFQLAIIDPPYGINAEHGTNLQTREKFSHKEYGWDSKPPDAAFFESLFRVSKNQIIWGANHFLFAPTANVIIWDKGITCRGRAFSDGELAWVSPGIKGFGRSGLRIFDGQQNDVSRVHGFVKERIHPTQKPVKLYEWILDKYAEEGDKILDTHMGSGSIAIASHYMGFALTACELDETYFNDACKRIREQTQQVKIDFNKRRGEEISEMRKLF